MLTGTVPSLGPGGTQTYTVTGNVTGTNNAPQAIANTATVTVPPSTGNVGTSTSATDNDDLLAITKFDNHGGSSVTGSTGGVAGQHACLHHRGDQHRADHGHRRHGQRSVPDRPDPRATRRSPWPAELPTRSDLGPGSTQTYTVTGTVTGTNTQSARDCEHGHGYRSPNGHAGTSTSATDKDDLLTITKVDNQGGSSITGSTGTVTPGNSLSYTIVVSNTGPTTVTGATVSDPFRPV